MLSWPFKKKPTRSPAAASAPRAMDDEWAFLRTQPDHDADEMSSVRARDEDYGAPAEAWAPAVEPDPTEWAEGEAEWSAPAAATAVAERPLVDAAQPEPGTLTLEISVGSRRAVREVEREALIGRRDASHRIYPDVDLTLDDAVSRRHAQIYTRGGRFLIRDLNSLNGTYYNGRMLQPEESVLLRPGDQVELGACSRIQVLVHGCDAGLTREDESIADLLQEALGGPGSGARAEEGPARTGDLLDLALEQGQIAGLLPDALHVRGTDRNADTRPIVVGQLESQARPGWER